MKNWTVYKDAWLPRFPHAPGVYVVFGDGQLLYVGSSTDLYKRIVHGHCIGVRGYGGLITTPWGKFKNVCIKCRVSKRYGDWAMREVRLIHRLNPPFNKAGKRKHGVAA